MGVNLYMKIGKHNFNLGRSYKYIDGASGSTVDTDLENLYNKKQYAADQLEKRIIAMAAHHPTKEEVNELLDEVYEMIDGYTDEIGLLSRCMVLAEIADNEEKIEFKVE
jgi:hypothetical protein